MACMCTHTHGPENGPGDSDHYWQITCIYWTIDTNMIRTCLVMSIYIYKHTSGKMV